MIFSTIEGWTDPIATSFKATNIAFKRLKCKIEMTHFLGGGLGLWRKEPKKISQKRSSLREVFQKNGNLQLGVGPPPLLRSEEFIGGRLDVFGLLFIIFLFSYLSAFFVFLS